MRTIVAVKSLLAGEYTLVSTDKKTKTTTRNSNNTLVTAEKGTKTLSSSSSPCQRFQRRRSHRDPTTPSSPSSPRRRRPNYSNTLRRGVDGDAGRRRRRTATATTTVAADDRQQPSQGGGGGGGVSMSPSAAAVVVVGGGGGHNHQHHHHQTSTTHPSDEGDDDNPSSSSDGNEDKEEDDDTTTASTYSAGLSTRTGDSFVLQIDWNHTTASSTGYYHDNNNTNNNNGLDESLEDPYLPKLESIRRRLLLGRRRQSESNSPRRRDKEEEGAHRQPLATIHPAVAETTTNRTTEARTMTAKHHTATSTLSPPPAKSLGTFAFPENDVEQQEEDQTAGPPPTDHLDVPRQPNFDPSNISSVLEEEDSDEDDDDYDDSFDDLPIGTINTVPVVVVPTNQSSSARSASSRRRKRRHAAVQKSRAIREALQRLQQESPTISTRSPLMLMRKKQDHDHDHHHHQQLKKAKLYLELGRSEQTARRYLSAINAFFQAAAIYRRYSSNHRHHHHRSVALATALDHAAVAYCQAQKNNASTMDIIHRQHKRTRFVHCLHEALQIRRNELGPWHVDTVDTLQHLAQLHLLSGSGNDEDIGLACTYFLEVVQLRQAIFGPHHPSTAVAAHCLGNAYLQSHDPVAAEIWYDNALQIYNIMELPDANPALTKLLHDRLQVQRVARWMTETDPADDENLLFEL